MFISGLKGSLEEIVGKRETKNVNELANKYKRRKQNERCYKNVR